MYTFVFGMICKVLVLLGLCFWNRCCKCRGVGNEAVNEQMTNKLDMRKDIIYQVTRESEISGRIVSELNAAVCTATFPSDKGIYKADLYHSVNSSPCLVFHKTCAPVHSTFVKTVLISF